MGMRCEQFGQVLKVIAHSPDRGYFPHLGQHFAILGTRLNPQCEQVTGSTGPAQLGQYSSVGGMTA